MVDMRLHVAHASVRQNSSDSSCQRFLAQCQTLTSHSKKNKKKIAGKCCLCAAFFRNHSQRFLDNVGAEQRADERGMARQDIQGADSAAAHGKAVALTESFERFDQLGVVGNQSRRFDPARGQVVDQTSHLQFHLLRCCQCAVRSVSAGQLTASKEDRRELTGMCSCVHKIVQVLLAQDLERVLGVAEDDLRGFRGVLRQTLAPCSGKVYVSTAHRQIAHWEGRLWIPVQHAGCHLGQSARS
eukprot:1433910-Rhodomonas_salina.4